jgi:TRAP-type C4-dicarboxylate transport system permease small subunit
MMIADFLKERDAVWRIRNRLIFRRVLKDYAIHTAKVLAGLAFVLFMGFGFCITGWTAANMPAPVSDPNFPLPSWVWTYSLGYIAFMCLVLMIYALFATLDNAFYRPDDTRRILKRHG